LGKTEVTVSSSLIGEKESGPIATAVVKLEVKNIRGIRIAASTTRLVAGEELMINVEGTN